MHSGKSSKSLNKYEIGTFSVFSVNSGIMIRKITAVGLIALFAGLTASPFIHLTDCNMACCIEIEKSCCEMEKEMVCPMMSDCGTTVFVPIVSGPFHKSALKSIDAVTNLVVALTDFPSFVIQAFQDCAHSDPGPIAALNLPLLI
jgi:hypothetical protein